MLVANSSKERRAATTLKGTGRSLIVPCPPAPWLFFALSRPAVLIPTAVSDRGSISGLPAGRYGGCALYAGRYQPGTFSAEAAAAGAGPSRGGSARGAPARAGGGGDGEGGGSREGGDSEGEGVAEGGGRGGRRCDGSGSA